MNKDRTEKRTQGLTANLIRCIIICFLYHTSTANALPMKMTTQILLPWQVGGTWKQDPTFAINSHTSVWVKLKNLNPLD